jgi:hypothetical protein
MVAYQSKCDYLSRICFDEGWKGDKIFVASFLESYLISSSEIEML